MHLMNLFSILFNEVLVAKKLAAMFSGADNLASSKVGACLRASYLDRPQCGAF
jgi:hypothetical protein